MATGAPIDNSFERGAAIAPSSVMRLIAVAMALLVLASIVYFSFVFGQKTLLYKDVGADSLNVFYPNYVLRSDYLRNHGLFSWAFEVGMGQNIFSSIGSLLVTPIVWLPKHAIAKGLIYQHFFYVLVCGLSFFRFLSGRGLVPETSFLGAALLSFSAYMCMGSCWYFHAAEVAAFALLLYCADCAANRGDWPHLVVAVAVMSLLGVFHLYLSALFLCLVVPVLIFLRKASLQRSTAMLLLLGFSAILGVALTSVITISGFLGVLNSPRGLGPTSMSHVLSGSGILRFASPEQYATAILRLFSNDLAGTGNDFAGWSNYLEAPMTYCGLICLLLLPQIFVGTTLRERIVGALFLLFLIVPPLFPWFRYLFWGFQGNYYRTFSLFGMLGLITLSMFVLSRYMRSAAFNLPVVLITTLLLEAILFLPIKATQQLIDSTVRREVAVLLAIYAALFAVGILLRRQRLFGLLIIATTLVELLYFDRRTIERPTVTKTELNERTGYNDYTIDAVRDIKAVDNSFFRITKTFGSSPAVFESLNDALVFGYYGTTSYSSFNDLNYVRFLSALETIPRLEMETYTQWSLGLLGHPLLLTFAGEKYVLTKEPAPYQMAVQYEQFGRYESYYVFRNNMFLPLGLVFKEYLPETTFLSLSAEQKAETLLHAVVLNASDTSARVKEVSVDEMRSEFEAQPIPETIQHRRATSLRLHNWSESHLGGEVDVDASSVLLLQMPFDAGWHATVDGEPTMPFRADCGLCGVFLQNAGTHQVQVWYVPPYRFLGACLSGLCLAIFSVGCFFWPRLRPI